jgi:signal transduction histidine kinase
MSAVRLLGLAMVAVVAGAALAGPLGWHDPLLVVALAVFAVAATVFLVRRRMPSSVGIALLALVAAAALTVVLLDPSQVPLGLFVLGALAPLARAARAGLVIAGLGTAAYTIAEVAAGRGGWTLGATASGVLFFALVGRLVVREREQRERIAELLVDLERSRAAEGEASAQAERARLAREVHDVLAHTLSGLAIHLEAARLLAAADGTAPALRDAVDRAHQLSRTGLEEARRAVGALRGEPLPGPASLARLVEEHRLAAGSRASLRERGDPFELSAEAGLALYRAAQEALSNVRKHAPGAPVDVSLLWAAGSVTLTIDDEGGGSPLAAPASGFGLAGMRERAELVGAELEAGPSERGFRVRLTVPRSREG